MMPDASSDARTYLRIAGTPQAQPTAQPAKTALFAGGKEPGLRANFFALINK
jgi:hypothetical protein